MIFKTESESYYEVDESNKRARRLFGRLPPTHYVGKDEVWKEYDYVSPIVIGKKVVFCWKDDTLDEMDSHPWTYTSLVEDIITKENAN